MTGAATRSGVVRSSPINSVRTAHQRNRQRQQRAASDAIADRSEHVLRSDARRIQRKYRECEQLLSGRV